MSKAKYAVGEKVDVRAEDYQASGVVVVRVSVEGIGRTFEFLNGEMKHMPDGLTCYTLESGEMMFEPVVFPHNPPSQFNTVDEIVKATPKTMQPELV